MPALVIHPDYKSAIDRIEVDVSRKGARLGLHYVAFGDIARIVVPPVAAPAPTNSLWKHTCFEVFARAPTGEGYGEFNFSPSTQWAAYAFSGHRSGMKKLDVPVPRIRTREAADQFELEVSFDLALAPGWRLGLSAVIEDAGGLLSYWALRHPVGKPDFHHADSFAYEVL